MDTNGLMSSLREMVQAEVHIQMIAAGVLHANAETLAGFQAKYSLHETAVREQLAELGRRASAHKEPPRFGGA